MKVLRRILALGVLTGVAVGFVASAFADDIQPPWWRGQYSTTSQYWEFLTSEPGPLQPDGSPPGGQPWLLSTHLTVYPDGQWLPSDLFGSGRVGIWPLSGEMRVTVDNHNPPNEYKWMWVQLTWHDEELKPATGPILSGFNPMYDPVPGLITVPDEDLGFGWYETTFQWFIHPNPPDEFFVIGGNILVDELVIDTWCIPEPSLFALAGLGVLLLAWRRPAVRD
ncbi:MAG TPA: hypothetical protein P5205_04720 [Candidatus Paceibacterota bacterium]|nr:hypothetical protein [Verrucomicrobiota bacterium]HSA09655.1 hypothetical protein [Candidatus Paceibacterota bacterium]